MLTLITGVPGSGKTSGAVDLILREYSDRPLYVDGLNGLKLEHVPVDVLNWPEEVPDGAVVVVDEVQRKWRPRGPGSKVPPSVAALETHRHRGLDFVLITQNPRLLDANVRALVGRHIHIRDTGWMGRWAYEWPECNVETAWAKCQNKRRYKLPKRVFDLYTSASMHTKPVRKVPLLLYILGVVLLGLAVAGYTVWRKAGKSEAPALAPVAGQGAAALPAPAALPDKPPPSADPTAPAGPPDERVDFMPRLSDRPWTAPAYDQLRQVVRMPVIAGAICTSARCACVTEDGYTLPEVSDKACREWLRQPAFNPYVLPKPPPTVAARAGATDGAAGHTASIADQTAPAPGASESEAVRLLSGVVNPREQPAAPLYLPAPPAQGTM